MGIPKGATPIKWDEDEYKRLEQIQLNGVMLIQVRNPVIL